MKQILGLYSRRLEPYRQQLLQQGPPRSVRGASLAFVAAASCDLFSRSLLVATLSNSEAEALAEEARLFQDPEKALFLPGCEMIPYSQGKSDAVAMLQRLRVLDRIRSGEHLLIFTSINALLRRVISPEQGRGVAVECAVGDASPPLQLLRQLLSYGYRRVERVNAPGEICLKGDIIDIFAINYPLPLRMDYFDDVIEDIRFFNFDSQQRSGESLSRARIIPAKEVILDKERSLALRKALKERAKQLQKEPVDDEWLSNLEELPGLAELFPLVFPATSLLAHFPEPPLLFLYPAAQMRESIARIRREFQTLYQRCQKERIALPPEQLLDNFPENCSAPLLWLGPYASREYVNSEHANGEHVNGEHVNGEHVNGEHVNGEHVNGEHVNGEHVNGEHVNGEHVNGKHVNGEHVNGEHGNSEHGRGAGGEDIFGISDTSRLRGTIPELRENIGQLLKEGGQVFISSPYPAQMRRMAAIFRNLKGVSVSILEDPSQFRYDPSSPALYLLCSRWREGFSVPDMGFSLVTDMEIFGRSYRSRRRFKQVASNAIDSFLDLKEGDYVVHVIHGIARFLALERVSAMGRERDFLVLQYAGEDRLYVPIDQISMVQRYLSSVEKPRLDSLGKSSFRRVRQRVEERIEQFAQELISIYAARRSRRGYQYPPDTIWQEEFEAAFIHEETPDQITATEDVKRDMESERPMNRLICGDVGYGKTEVAIRAAFKAVLAGRQVVLIAPTTILALQHLRTLQERFASYPISIDWISRFRSSREIGQIKTRLLQGELDMVVGTHALLAGDIRIPNLGLLIIDEEQRFGVMHKEAIKRLRTTVDTLTISATPIPRSLHMSLIGIHDLSIIGTPPVARRAVQTYVVEDNDSIISDAIQREIGRGGQLFYLHNRVGTIEAAALRLQQLAPDISIATLHGRMEKERIEDILMQFQERGIDMLVTTTIIENGIDMPNVNTLIIDRADRYGLSQLYQIRGRVGRSARQAYAYLLYPAALALSETAQNRLNTIFEYQELGSGFKVAMRDLEIRGAGNVLGREQSGHIADVGYELYVKLLNEAVARLKGLPAEEELHCSVSLPVDFYLPESYIPDVRQRIEFYKRFEAARLESIVSRLAGEMLDRFGPPPEAAVTFVLVESIRTLGQGLGLQSISADSLERVQMTPGENCRLSSEQLLHLLSQKRSLQLRPSQPNLLFFFPEEEKNCLQELVSLLHNLSPAQEQQEAPQPGAGAGVEPGTEAAGVATAGAAGAGARSAR